MPEGVDQPVPKPWTATRPGDDLTSHNDNEGALIGHAGPNVGYAYTLIHRELDNIVLVDGEHMHDVEPLLAEIASRRAAYFGRAPIKADIGFAIRLLSFGGVPAKGEEKWRPQLVHDCGHDEHRRRTIVNSIPIPVLEGGEHEIEESVQGWWERLEGLF